MTETQPHQPFTLPWGGSGTIEDLVEIFTEHEETHAKEIRDIILKGKWPTRRAAARQATALFYLTPF